MRVDRTGTFLAIPIDWGIDKTKEKGYPTFNVQAKLIHYYDETSGEWIAWEEYEQEATAYLCLYGTNRKSGDVEPTLNHQQVMKVFDWNGESFAELANGDYSEVVFQIKIKDNDPEYAASNPFTVSYIDVADANPIRGLKKLDADAVKELDSFFAVAAKKSAKAKTAASAPKTPPAAPPKTKQSPAKAKQQQSPSTEKVSPDSLEEKRRKILEKSKKNLEANKKTPAPPARKTPATAPTPPTNEDIGDGLSKQDAWCTVVELKRDDVTDAVLNETWNGAIDDVAGEGVESKDITDKQWKVIMNKVLDKVAKF